MKSLIIFLLVMIGWLAPLSGLAQNAPARLRRLLDTYAEAYYQLHPLYASSKGIYRYNHLVENINSESYRAASRKLYTAYLDSLSQIKAQTLSADDRLTLDCFRYDLSQRLERLRYPNHLLPVSQLGNFPAGFARHGSGEGYHPFKTPKDYTDFLARIQAFGLVIDTTIACLRQGVAQGIVQPRFVIERTLGQLRSFLVDDVTQSVYYKPILNMPVSFSAEQQQQFTQQYRQAIAQAIIPAYRRLSDYLGKGYLPACRQTVGWSALPGGKAWYEALVRQHTTTQLTPDEIHAYGLQEVARIRKEMAAVQQQLGIPGDFRSFLNTVRDDPKLKPFRSDSAILSWFEQIHQTMQPGLQRLFNRAPKTPFAVRAVEKYMASSVSAHYMQGSPDGSRPGVFYVPIPDPATYLSICMESLFLHEAIPGHHYQLSLQAEDQQKPQYRQNAGFGAFTEGWALYTEGLGKELGLFKDPYQYLGWLQSEMHRAVRLVVDTGIHAKGWTREQAIRYSLDNEAITEAHVIQEVERYIVNPGQALSYKIGQKYILAGRQRAEKALGSRFDIRAFHDHVLTDGSIPLDLFDRRINEWITAQKQLAVKK